MITLITPTNDFLTHPNIDGFYSINAWAVDEYNAPANIFLVQDDTVEIVSVEQYADSSFTDAVSNISIRCDTSLEAHALYNKIIADATIL
jgi:hypothetical protein